MPGESVKKDNHFDIFPSRDCLNVLHAAWKHAGYFFYKTWKIPGLCMETFCRITMQLPLFQLKLKTIRLHRRDHFVFTRKFLKYVPYVITVSQRARWIWRYFETYHVTEICLHWKRGKIDWGLSCFQN